MPKRNSAPARSPASGDRQQRPDRPSIAGRARNQTGGRPSDCRRRETGARAWVPIWMRGSGPRMTGKIRRKTSYITRMRPQDILMPVPAGLCCKPGGFHIDPVRPVERAVITHGHSDHARPGHGAVLATQETLDMMRLRYGDNFARSTQAIRYGEEVRLGEVKIKFHPAGHVLGSAQVAVNCKDTCIVASGDYKDAPV